MDKFKKMMSFCCIVLAPIILILLFGFFNRHIKILTQHTFQPYILFKIPIYMIFGVCVMTLGIQKPSGMNLAANIVGFLIILSFVTYYVLYDTNLFYQIEIFGMDLIFMINQFDVPILFGSYLFNIIRITYLLMKKPVQ